MSSQYYILENRLLLFCLKRFLHFSSLLTVGSLFLNCEIWQTYYLKKVIKTTRRFAGYDLCASSGRNVELVNKNLQSINYNTLTDYKEASNVNLTRKRKSTVYLSNSKQIDKKCKSITPNKKNCLRLQRNQDVLFYVKVYFQAGEGLAALGINWVRNVPSFLNKLPILKP